VIVAAPQWKGPNIPSLAALMPRMPRGCYGLAGLGDTQCVIDPDGVQRCDELPSAVAAFDAAPGVPLPTVNLSGTAKQWIPGVSNTVVMVGGATVVVLLLMTRRRR
jgi:hypothetical protein